MGVRGGVDGAWVSVRNATPVSYDVVEIPFISRHIVTSRSTWHDRQTRCQPCWPVTGFTSCGPSLNEFASSRLIYRRTENSWRSLRLYFRLRKSDIVYYMLDSVKLRDTSQNDYISVAAYLLTGRFRSWRNTPSGWVWKWALAVINDGGLTAATSPNNYPLPFWL